MMIEILAVATALLAIGDVLSGWLIAEQRRLIARLKLRIEQLEHPERFPPEHPMCRSTRPTFWGRDLIADPLPARKPPPNSDRIAPNKKGRS